MGLWTQFMSTTPQVFEVFIIHCKTCVNTNESIRLGKLAWYDYDKWLICYTDCLCFRSLKSTAEVHCV